MFLRPQGFFIQNNFLHGSTVTSSVTVNATGTENHTNSGTSATNTGLTIVAGSNIALVVSMNWEVVLPTGASVSWDGVPMTEIISVDNALTQRCSLWGLVNPNLGNKTISASWTGTAAVFICGIAFNGVKQTGGTSSFSNSASATSASTVNVTSTATGIVVGTQQVGGSQGTATGTLIFDDHTNGTVVNAMMNRMAGTGGVVAIGNSGTNALLVGTNVVAA